MIPGDLGYMQEGINTRKQFHKCTEISHSCNFAADDRSDCETIRSFSPGILIREFQGKSNLLFLDVLDQDSELIADMEILMRIFDTSPGHLGNVKQAVCSAKIYKCAEIRNILHGTFDHIARLNS